jgi:histidinol-phosphate aminotransferase
MHVDIKTRLATLRSLPGPEYVFLGVGSDEVIDLVMRVVCAPGKDKVLVTPPTYGMYGVTAQVNDVEVVEVPLDVSEGRFSVQVGKVCFFRLVPAPSQPSPFSWSRRC